MYFIVYQHALIYTLPLKIFNRWAEKIDREKIELIQEIKELNEWEYRKEKSKLTDNDVLNFLQWESISILLELMNISISYATKDNTHRFIDSFEYNKDPLYKLEHLMGLDNRDSEDFFKEAILLFEENNENLFKIMLLRISRHYMINSNKINWKTIQKLNQKLWEGKLNSQILLVEKNKIEKRKN